MFLFKDLDLLPWKGLMWIYKNSVINCLLSVMSMGSVF